MSSRARIPKAEITGVYGCVVKQFSRRLLGDVPEPAEVMWHNRAVLASSMGFGGKVQECDELDPNLKPFAAVAVHALIGCSWCPDFGCFHAGNEGLGEAKASEVPRWRESPVFTSLERDVMEYAEAMSVPPGRPTSAPTTPRRELAAAPDRRVGAMRRGTSPCDRAGRWSSVVRSLLLVRGSGGQVAAALSNCHSPPIWIGAGPGR
jgi:hypothetical protein